MELRRLRHFIAVAEELHFGRAAARLKMAQPPLSHSIRKFEAEIGTRLFDRTKRYVTLTPAGQFLLEEGRRVVTHLDVLHRLTLKVGTEDRRKLRIGFTPMAMYTTFLPKILQEFRGRWPGADLALVERGTGAQLEAVAEGDLDAGFIVHQGAPLDGFSNKIIDRHRLVAAVPSKWPIAAKKKVRLAQLGELPFVMHEAPQNKVMHDLVLAACRSAGFVPRVVQQASQNFTLLTLVAQEMGITLTRDAASSITFHGVTFVEIEDLPADIYVNTVLVWLPNSTNVLLTQFVATVDRLLVPTKTPTRYGSRARRSFSS
ncbi:MAG TPA: LysR family transcriptional regulator [Burkholderiales bacterium]|nr:LysR family transcriptional regulator [Burkholderiales bacterium]